MAAFLLVPAVSVFFVIYLLSKRYSRGLYKYPGPFLASFTDLWKVWYAYRHDFRRQNKFYVDVHQIYGPVVRIGPNELIFSDPRAVSEIYSTRLSLKKSELYRVYSAPPSKGVVPPLLLPTRDGPWHDLQRRLVNRAFTMTAILKYEPAVDEMLDVFQQRLDEQLGEEVDLPKWLAFYAADVISHMTFGQPSGFMAAGTDVDNTLERVRLITQFWLWFSRMPLLSDLTVGNPLLPLSQRFLGWPETPNTPFRRVAMHHFAERKAIWSKKEGKDDHPETLVDHFLDAEAQYADKMDLVPFSHATTVVVAGSESTAGAMGALLYALLKNPEKYRKLQNEINAKWADQLTRAEDSKTFSWAVAQTMPYLQACIQESFRLYSGTKLPHARVAPTGGIEICGNFVPEGTDIYIMTTVAHRDTSVFGEDVETFRPERWLEGDERTTRLMKDVLSPFSQGKYNCQGRNIAMMEINKTIPSLLLRYEMRLPSPDFTWTLGRGPFGRASDLRVYFKKRDLV